MTAVDIEARLEALLALCNEKAVVIATAESCTGGLVAATLTDIAGSSAMVDRGFVTYSNPAKTEMLGVPGELLDRHGAVSGEVASAMAEGALARSNADVTISVTGIAGPDGGTDLKPVGLVWFGCAAAWAPTFVHKTVFPNNGRGFVREAAVMAAVEILTETIRLAPNVESSA
ncbi:CinA family protein [Oricola cellulosilytica]|uniref:CinA family protein n=1 Tax=Oricola cellulosilytica TaxID=1429082 RepID=A0A4R0P7W9_9HYPH|nr:nicotinamide-nucleotide amidohydrolase family protein [Oricola cellulosilytica]TCD13141.1 CinA family protein [Oricola cellulosilytica]